MSADSRQPIIGVDVGGTKVAAASVVGHRAEHLIERPTETGDSAGLIAGIAAAIDHVSQRAGAPAAIGIGLPSQVDYATGRVVSSVNIPLEGVSLSEALGERLSVPVFVDNDANCAALAEAYYAKSPNIVMYTLGTGVGGGVVIDGRIFRGATGLGAELGHVVIRADGPDCPGSCPNRGCLEALCSGTALGRDGDEWAKDHPGSALGQRRAANGSASARDVVELARERDPDALRLLERFADDLGVGLSNAVNAYEPEEIVIGGGLSQVHELFLERAWAEAGARALPALFKRVRIAVARAGPAAGVIGAGLLAAQEIGRNMDTAHVTASEGIR